MENITEGMKFKSNVTDVVYTFVCKKKSPTKNYTDILLRSDVSGDVLYVPEHKLLECFTPQKFIAVSGDQSLFDLVGSEDEHLYMIFNKRYSGIYALTKDEMDSGRYDVSRVLAERKLIEPEPVPYHTDTYLHKGEDFAGVDITAFRDRSGYACINVSCNPGNVEVVLDKGQTLKFANELIAIANGVECKQ